MCLEKSLIWFVSNSVWEGLNHTLRCHRRDDLCKLIARCVKQRAEFSFGAFSSSGHHQHIQIEKLAETIDTVVRHNHIHQQQPAIPGHRSTAILEDSNGTIVIPIVDHATQQVSGCSLWNRSEEISGNV
jgi:hypothetical protein